MSTVAEMTYPEFLFSLIRWEFATTRNTPSWRENLSEYINRQTQKLEMSIMSSKSNNNRNGNNGGYNNITFVNVPLGNKDKAQFKSWFSDNERELPNLLATFIASGYKLSVKWDIDNQCYIATFTCDATGLTNHAKALSSRSNDWLEAIALGLWKTDVLCEDGKWPTEKQGFNWG